MKFLISQNEVNKRIDVFIKNVNFHKVHIKKLINKENLIINGKIVNVPFIK